MELVPDDNTDPFKTGDAWRYFLSLERSLGEFIEYVPLDDRNRNVYSPKLATILISAATQVEAIFKAIISSNYLDTDKNIDQARLATTRKAIGKKGGNLELYRRLLEPYFLLSKRKVTIRQYPKVYRRIFPFLKFRQDRPPAWWQSYTSLKHSFYDNIREARLNRAFSGVAALFVMQLMHLPNRKTLIDLGVIHGGFKDMQIRDYSKSYLKELLASPSLHIDEKKAQQISDIWAETEFFETDLVI